MSADGARQQHEYISTHEQIQLTHH